MAPDPTPSPAAAPPPLLAPDSAWRFRNGVEAAGLRVPGGRTRHLSAIVTLPAGWPVDPLFETDLAGVRMIPTVPVRRRDRDVAATTLPVLIRLDELGGLRSADLTDALGAYFHAAYPRAELDASGATVRIGDPVPDAAIAPPSVSTAPSWTPDEGLLTRKPRAVVAVIDDGIPFAHRALRNASGGRTRVEFCWLQGAAAAASSRAGGPATGREYLRNEIDALIAAHGTDEDVLYHEAGATTPRYEYGATIGHFGTHGSHAIATAAGSPDAPDADLIRIVAVQLAPATTLDTTGHRSEPAILAAVNYVLDCVDQIEAGHGCTDLPLILNFSYGYTGGPHDGTSSIAAEIRRLLDARGKPTALTLPAGNTFGSCLAGQVRTPACDPLTATIRWRLEPSDRTASPLELWFAAGANLSSLAIELRDPTGFAAATLPAGDIANASRIFDVKNRTGEVVGRIASRVHGVRRCVTIRLDATDTPPGGPEARAGLWRLVLNATAASGLAGPIDCRIGRDFNPIGYFQGARQSRFDPGEPPFDDRGRPVATDDPAKFLRRFDTLNDLATGAAHTVVVGATHASPDRPARYSSAAGPGAPEPSVDCAAPIETIDAVPGVRGAGTRSGSTFRMSGTSAAAPMLAVEIADVFRTGTPRPPNPKPEDMIGPVAFSQTAHMAPRLGAGAAETVRGGRFRYEADPPVA